MNVIRIKNRAARLNMIVKNVPTCRLLSCRTIEKNASAIVRLVILLIFLRKHVKNAAHLVLSVTKKAALDAAKSHI
jgi:hypothetical protein